MTYEIEFKPRSIKDLQSIPKSMAQRIVEKTEALRTDLAGDVKRLTDSTPEYRLRVGDYRVLYEVRDRDVLVLVIKIGHRREVYR